MPLNYDKTHLQYIDILVILCITLVIGMSTAVSLRLPDELVHELENLANATERSKTYIIRKAIASYLRESADYMVALERLNDKDDKVISSDEMRERLAIPD